MEKPASASYRQLRRHHLLPLLRIGLSLALPALPTAGWAQSAENQSRGTALPPKNFPVQSSVSTAPALGPMLTLSPTEPSPRLDLGGISAVLMSGEPVLILPETSKDSEGLLCAETGWKEVRLRIEFDGRCLRGCREDEVAVNCYRSGRPGQCLDTKAKRALREHLVDDCGQFARRLERVYWPTGATEATIPAWSLSLRFDGASVEVNRPGRPSVTHVLEAPALPSAVYYWPASQRLIMRIVSTAHDKSTKCIMVSLS